MSHSIEAHQESIQRLLEQCVNSTQQLHANVGELNKLYKDVTQQLEKIVSGDQLKSSLEYVSEDMIEAYTREQLDRSHISTPSFVPSSSTYLIDYTIHLAENDVSNIDLPFLLIENLFELTPILTGCQEIFNSYLSSRIDRLSAIQSLPQRNKLILLRICNALLRRLSKSINTSFAGDILLLLTYVLPIDERSGVNVNCKFNTNNITHIESNQTATPSKSEAPNASHENAMDTKTASTSPPASIKGGRGDDNKSFYQALWSLQQYFCNPVLLKEVTHWKSYTNAVDSVLSVFDIHPTQDNDSGRINEKGEMFYPKYLTSSKLLHLQLSDNHFRRHILLQLLFVNHYLINPQGSYTIDMFNEAAAATPAPGTVGTATTSTTSGASVASSTAAKSSGTAPKVINTATASTVPLTAAQQTGSVRPSPFINATQQSTIRAFNTHILQLLKNTPPNGHQFLSLVQQLLVNENAYIKWKANRCPEIAKPQADIFSPLNVDQLATSHEYSRANEDKNAEDAKVGTKRKSADALNGLAKRKAIDKYRPQASYLMGSPELASLWQQENTWDMLSDSARQSIPSKEDILEGLIDEELDDTIDVELKQKSDPRIVWKTLRVLMKSDMTLFTQSKGTLDNVVKSVIAQRDKKNTNSDRAEMEVKEGGAAEIAITSSEADEVKDIALSNLADSIVKEENADLAPGEDVNMIEAVQGDMTNTRTLFPATVPDTATETTTGEDAITEEDGGVDLRELQSSKAADGAELTSDTSLNVSAANPSNDDDDDDDDDEDDDESQRSGEESSRRRRNEEEVEEERSEGEKGSVAVESPRSAGGGEENVDQGNTAVASQRTVAGNLTTAADADADVDVDAAAELVALAAKQQDVAADQRDGEENIEMSLAIDERESAAGATTDNSHAVKHNVDPAHDENDKTHINGAASDSHNLTDTAVDARADEQDAADTATLTMDES